MLSLQKIFEIHGMFGNAVDPNQRHPCQSSQAQIPIYVGDPWPFFGNAVKPHQRHPCHLSQAQIPIYVGDPWPFW